MASIILKGVKKGFSGHPVLRGINLEISDGEFVVFVGPSGCGKSTLLRLMAGLEPVSEGQIFMDGADMTSASPVERRVAMVFQSYALYPHMTVEENIGFGLRIAGQDLATRRAAVHRAAEALHLTPYLQRRPATLSGGQRQRVAIGRAIVKQPRLFLFDEPLSNLDAELRAETRLEIARLHRSLKTTMVYVTHDQVEAMTLADRIVILRDGQVAQSGSPDALYHDPDDIFIARFLGSPKINLFPGFCVSADRYHTLAHVPALGVEPITMPALRAYGNLVERRITLGIRPHHLQLSHGNPGWSGRVVDVESLGDLTHVHLVDLDEASFVLTVGDGKSLSFGQDVGVAPRAEKILIFDEVGNRLR